MSSDSGTRARGPIANASNSSRRAMPWERIVLVAAILTLASSIALAATDEYDPPPPMTEALAQRIDDLSVALRSPLLWSERYPGAALLTVWISGEAEPHRSAIRGLGGTRHPDAAYALADVIRRPDFPYRFEAMFAASIVPNLVLIPPLIEALDDSEVRIGRVAARVLGVVISELIEASKYQGKEELGPELESAIEVSQAALTAVLESSPEPARRVAALHGLVIMGTEDAMFTAYRLAIKDSHYLVRCGLLADSLDFIGKRKGARVTPAHVRKALRNNLDPNAADTPVSVVTRAYYHTKYYSSISFKSDCVDIQQVAMNQLAWMRDPAARPSLFRAVRSLDPEMRATAAFSLAQFEDDEAHLAVAAALDDPLWGVRRSAIKGLGNSEHPKADAQLAKILETGNRLDRREAAKSLAGSFGASVRLIEAFSDPAVEVRNEAEEALLRSDEVVTELEVVVARLEGEPVSEAQRQQNAARRANLREGLEAWKLERRAAERALIDGLADDDARVRIRSARVLARYQSAESLSLLIEILDSGTSPQSEVAALALGLKGAVGARASLERAARSDRVDLAVASIRALQDLGDPASLPLLRSLESGGGPKRLTTAARYAVAILDPMAE
jgi:HEAT repeat protein